MSTRAKDFLFPVSVVWLGDKRVHAHVTGKQPIEIATPPEFGGDDPATWSPEDFLVAAAASCYSVTLVAIAGRRQIPLYDLTVEAAGRLGALEDGRFGFRAIELNVQIETEVGQIAAVRKAAERAEHGCFVSLALGIPVKVELDVRAREPAAQVN
jgi:peroxiredoxin-like protein